MTSCNFLRPNKKRERVFSHLLPEHNLQRHHGPNPPAPHCAKPWTWRSPEPRQIRWPIPNGNCKGIRKPNPVEVKAFHKHVYHVKLNLDKCPEDAVRKRWTTFAHLALRLLLEVLLVVYGTLWLLIKAFHTHVYHVKLNLDKCPEDAVRKRWTTFAHLALRLLLEVLLVVYGTLWLLIKAFHAHVYHVKLNLDKCPEDAVRKRWTTFAHLALRLLLEVLLVVYGTLWLLIKAFHTHVYHLKLNLDKCPEAAVRKRWTTSAHLALRLLLEVLLVVYGTLWLLIKAFHTHVYHLKTNLDKCPEAVRKRWTTSAHLALRLLLEVLLVVKHGLCQPAESIHSQHGECSVEFLWYPHTTTNQAFCIFGPPKMQKAWRSRVENGTTILMGWNRRIDNPMQQAKGAPKSPQWVVRKCTSFLTSLTLTIQSSCKKMFSSWIGLQVSDWSITCTFTLIPSVRTAALRFFLVMFSMVVAKFLDLVGKFSKTMTSAPPEWPISACWNGRPSSHEIHDSCGPTVNFKGSNHEDVWSHGKFGPEAVHQCLCCFSQCFGVYHPFAQIPLQDIAKSNPRQAASLRRGFALRKLLPRIGLGYFLLSGRLTFCCHIFILIILPASGQLNITFQGWNSQPSTKHQRCCAPTDPNFIVSPIQLSGCPDVQVLNANDTSWSPEGSERNNPHRSFGRPGCVVRSFTCITDFILCGFGTEPRSWAKYVLSFSFSYIGFLHNWTS